MKRFSGRPGSVRRAAVRPPKEGDPGNRPIVERIFELQRAIHAKNDAMAMALQRAIIPLLECPTSLASVTREDLLALDGVGPKTVDLIQRLIAGEAVEAVAASVPTIVRNPQGWPSSRSAPDRGNWDGSWDNSVRSIEEGK
jgi:hypothetical protein